MSKYFKKNIIMRTLIGIVVVTLLFVAGCGGAQQQSAGEKKEAPKQAIKVIIAHEVATTHWKHGFVEKYAKLAEERSGGRVKFEIYPGSQLYNERDAVASLGSGSVQMVWPLSLQLEQLNESYGVVSLPMAVDDSLILKTPQFRQDLTSFLTGLVENKNIKVLGLLRASGIGFAFGGKDVTDIKKINGKKIRVSGGQSVIDWVKTMGATPVAMPASEMTTALAQGTIDGILTSPSGWSEIVGPAAKSGINLGDFVVATYTVVVDKKWWDGLPVDIQKILRDTMDEVSKDQWQFSIDTDKKSMDKVSKEFKANVYETTDEDMKQLFSTTKPAIDRFQGKFPDVFKGYVDLNAKYGRKYPL